VEDDLIIPIYLDTNVLLDLLASIEDGFAVMEKVTTKQVNTTGANRELSSGTGTEFGVPNVLSLLRLTLGFSSSGTRGREEHQEREAERYHTYGSLLFKLRAYLKAKEVVKTLDRPGVTWEEVKPSDFVEVRGIFRPNPFATWLTIADRVLALTQLLSGLSDLQGSSTVAKAGATRAGAKRPVSGKAPSPEKPAGRGPGKQMEQIRTFFQGVLSDIQREQVRSFVIDLALPEQHKAVCLLVMDYLRDQTMLEISSREYRMLGKVVRKIDADSGATVDLLAGTGFGGLARPTLDSMLERFAEMPGMNLPEIETQVAGPALEIVPIAIFV